MLTNDSSFARKRKEKKRKNLKLNKKVVECQKKYVLYFVPVFDSPLSASLQLFSVYRRKEEKKGFLSLKREKFHLTTERNNNCSSQTKKKKKRERKSNLRGWGSRRRSQVRSQRRGASFCRTHSMES